MASGGLRTSRVMAELVDGDRIVGESSFQHELKRYIARVAPTDANVLITGETGTGKELVASLLHANSRRREQPFVCINCAAIPEELLESELFGYERGAFTGARMLKEGKLKAADRGTVFLDEVGDMSLSGQAKILRAIENRRVERLGSSGSVGLNVRVISATNQNLEESVSEGRFRKDLYFRLNVARIQLAPLREHKEDIPLLLAKFMREFEERCLFDELVLEVEVRKFVERYDWPGNVRELRNFAEALCSTCSVQRVSCADLPEPFRTISYDGGSPRGEHDERILLLTALAATNWNMAKAAKSQGWSRMTVYRKLEKYHLKRPWRVN